MSAAHVASRASPLVMSLWIVGLSAIAIRLLAYTGFFGSDEITYIDSALKPLDGDWTIDAYVGANRLGVNLPMTLFGALLGRNEFAMATWGMLCSIGEVLLVCWVGTRLAGARVGLFAGLLLATMPAHVHAAGRMLADPALGLAITAAFGTFVLADRRASSLGYFVAGVFAGLSFLVKPVTLFVFAILLLYPLLERRWRWQWLWMAVGLLVCMVANGLLYQFITGRFWLVFEAMMARRASGYLEAGVVEGGIADSPWYYLVYLFGKVWHTGLVGFAAALGLVCWLRNRQQHEQMRFVAFWGLGLILILSVLPVSFRPLTLVPKQTNYMLIFAAPLALLGGFALSRLHGRWAGSALGLGVVTGAFFSLLLQANVSVFTANSWLTVQWLREHPGEVMHVMSNAARAVEFRRMLAGEDLSPRVLPLATLLRPPPGTAPRWAAIDTQSFEWDGSKPFKNPQAAPACWELVRSLRGVPGGVGVWTLSTLTSTLAMAGTPGQAVSERVRSWITPRELRLYRVPAGC